MYTKLKSVDTTRKKDGVGSCQQRALAVQKAACKWHGQHEKGACRLKELVGPSCATFWVHSVWFGDTGPRGNDELGRGQQRAANRLKGQSGTAFIEPLQYLGVTQKCMDSLSGGCLK